jgi:hypothetical protein
MDGAALGFLLIALLVLATSTILFREAAGSLSPRRPNLVAWVFYYELLFLSFIGITLGVMGTPHYLLDRATDASVRKAFYAVCYVMIAMPTTMVLVQWLLPGGRSRRLIRAYLGRPMQPLQSPRDTAQRFFWIFMTLIAAGATAYTFAIIRELPYLALLGAGDGDSPFVQLRQEAKFGFTGNVYVRNLLSLILAPLTAYVALAYALLRRRLGDVVWATAASLVGIAAVTYSGEKAPLVLFLLGLGLTYGYARGGLSYRELALMGTGAVGLVASLYVATAGSVGLALTTGPLGRLMFSQIAPLALHLDTFPERVGFLQGASFPQWMVGPFGLEHVRSARIVMEIYNPTRVAAGEAGVMNTLFLGEAWANFGWVGLLIAPIIVGVVVQSLHYVLLRLPKSPVFVGAMAYITLRIPITGGFVDFLWNLGWLFLTVILIASLFAHPFLLDVTRHTREAEAQGA